MRLKIFYRHFARWIPWDWGRRRDRLTDWRPCSLGDCDVSHHGSNLTSLVRNWKQQQEKTCYIVFMLKFRFLNLPTIKDNYVTRQAKIWPKGAKFVYSFLDNLLGYYGFWHPDMKITGFGFSCENQVYFAWRKWCQLRLNTTFSLPPRICTSR